jgi:hypothetical protein
MRNYILTISLFLFNFVALQAQNNYYPEQHELLYLNNHWLSTNNAAGLSFSDFQVHGNSELGYNDARGNLHRAQEGDAKSGLKFTSERFDKINDKWLTWGSFEFQMKSEDNRAWSDAFNTYNNSPYIFGDSVKGRYDLQFFDLHAKISRKINQRWAVGIALDYFAGDMSRLRDARTRSFIANYAAFPSVIYQLTENQTLGLAAGIRFEKEKMPSITTVQQSPKIDYYFFLGNENSYSLLDGYIGFDRQYVNLDYSVGLQHTLKNDQFNWLNSLDFTTKNQEVLGSERESPGNYTALKFNILSKLNYKFETKLLHVVLNGFYNAGRANEFLQERVEVRDTANGSVSYKWNTLYAYKGRYTTDSYKLELKANLRNLLNNGTDYSWSGGVDGQFYGFSNIYQLPYSAFENQRARVGLNGSVRVFNKNQHRVTLQAAGGYGFSVSDNLKLNSIATTVPEIGSTTFEKATYKLATNILLPDLQFYKENVFDVRADVRYSFPLKVKKNVLTGQVKAYIGMQQGNTLGSWTSAGVSVGIITL